MLHALKAMSLYKERMEVKVFCEESWVCPRISFRKFVQLRFQSVVYVFWSCVCVFEASFAAKMWCSNGSGFCKCASLLTIIHKPYQNKQTAHRPLE